MATRLFCARGHQWDVDDATASRTGDCPQCGAPGTVTDADSTVDPSTAASEPAEAKESNCTRTYHPDEGSESLESIQVASDSVADGMASPHRDAASIPGYEILRELGRGGMGVVYQARQTALGRTIALKMILSGSHAGASELARFRTEAGAIARLQHPNIVQIHEVGEHEGRPYFSLEFCDGGSLSARLRENPLPPRDAAAMVQKIAQGMAVAHERGIIHRDLKPANVLLTAAGEPKVADFGLAKRMEDEGDLTRSGAIMGTPSYMAPEQALGEVKQVGPSADIYALGAILYECLTGRPPFRAATTLETLDQVRRREPVAPSQLNSQIPRDLETICLKCLQKEPAKRYATSLALADDLGRFRDGKPIAARPISRPERLVKWVRRNPVAAALIVVLVLGLAGSSAASYFALRQRDRAIAAETQRAEEQEKRLTEQQQRVIETILAAARVAGQRGDWPEVLRNLDRAMREGVSLSVADRLLRIRAMEASYRPREALAELKLLAEDPNLGEHAGAVDLYRGELLVGVDDVESEKFLRRALTQPLVEADRHYVQALLADSIPEARDGFLRAIAADRLQRDARTLAGLLLYLEGRFDEADRLADQSELLFPDHPDAHLLHAIVSAGRGDTNGMGRHLDRVVPLYGKDIIESLKHLLELVPVISQSLSASSGSTEDLPVADKFKLALFFSRALTDQGRMTALMRAWRDDDGEVERFPMFRFPPSFRSLKKVVDLLHQENLAAQRGEEMSTLIARDPKKLADLEKLTREVPFGLVHFYHGFVLLLKSLDHLQMNGQDRRHAELLDASAAAYEGALRVPGFIDVRLVSMDGFILTKGFRGSPRYAYPDPDSLKAAVAMIARRQAIAPFPPARYEMVMKVLRSASEWNQARMLVDEWLKRTPDNVYVQTWKAEVEFGAGNWTMARQWARTALAKKKDNARMQEIAAESARRIQAASKE